MGVFRNLTLTLTLALPGALLVGSTPSAAIPDTIALFKLFDHGEGNLGPDYGVRIDALPTPGSADGLLFSVEDDLGDSRVMLMWNLNTNSVTIEGTLRTIVPAGGLDTLVIYTLEGVTPLGAGPEDGFKATSGSGFVNGFGIAGQLGDSGRTACGAGIVFCVAPDGHRTDPFNVSTIVGTGWLEADGTNDWLVTLVPMGVIPEPNTALLLGLGISILGLRSRRRP